MDKNLLSTYKSVIENCKGIELKGKTTPYTSANGHMFSFINKENQLGFRFDKKVQEKYIQEWPSTYLYSHGSKMKGYVLIPEDMLDDLEALTKYLQESHEYVCSLPAK